jgi:hypothetical protein
MHVPRSSRRSFVKRVAGESRLHSGQGVLSVNVFTTAVRPCPVEISGLTDLLLLYDLRSGLGDAAFYEISLNFEFLLRAEVHHGIEGQVAG